MKPDSLPVVLLTGFLGAGKTTLLNALLQDPAMTATAVLVNEFGAVGIDQALIQQACGDVVLLENGCVCCTVREGLAAALLELVERRDRGDVPPFERIVIESTGLADPIPIIQLIMEDPDVSHRYQLLQVVTVADATCAEATLDEHPQAVTQAASADCVWISKADIASCDSVDALRARLEEMSPAASVLSATIEEDHRSLVAACSAPLATAFFDRRLGWSRLTRTTHGLDCVCCARPSRVPDNAHGGICSASVLRAAPLHWDIVGPWLDMLMQTRGSDILRLKGILCIEGDETAPWAIHAVRGHLCAPERLPRWAGAERVSRLVVILREGSQEEIEESFRDFETQHFLVSAAASVGINPSFASPST